MKLQGLSIVFGLIVIPLALVLTYYIQMQVDTITLQTSYDTKLLDATHDAMVAFELNTANEDLSSVADSLRSIIDASNNVFFNTLATNMGLSNAGKKYMEPYIPAVLYTLYDGYYISSPTYVPEVGVDANGVALEIAEHTDIYPTTKFSIPGLTYDNVNKIYEYNSDDTVYHEITTSNPIPAEDYGQLLYKMVDSNGNIIGYTTNVNHPDVSYKIENVLKSYMPYSARYIYDDGSGYKRDITINYTLDNYLTIVADMGDEKFTKSGYLINPNLVDSATVLGIDLLKYNENDAEEKIIEALGNAIPVELKLNVKDNSVEPPQDKVIIISTDMKDSAEASAIIYYTKAKIFSEWVYTNLSGLQENHIIENISDTLIGETIKGHDEVVYTFDGKTNYIFNSSQDPELNSSTFMNHKFQVIRNSIQYNLNLAMSIYNERTSLTYDFNMPVISDDEWHKIINNISILTFMQGLNCGLKTYNNYAIVSSTNNEVTVIPSEIYYVNNGKFDDQYSYYHRIDCPNFIVSTSEKLTAFVSKEVKYDKIYDKNATTQPYQYDHRNLACYTCIVDGNYTPVVLDETRLSAYYVAVGKERYNLYKMNAIKYSEGYKVIYDTEIPSADAPDNNTGDFSKIKSIEITFGNIPTSNWTESTVSINFSLPQLLGSPYILNTNQTKEQTIVVPVNSFSTAGSTTAENIKNSIEIDTSNVLSTITSGAVRNAVKSIKVIYK